MTVTPSAAVITNAQSLNVAVAVAGASGQPAPSGVVTLGGGSYSSQQTLAGGAASFSIPAGVLNNGPDTLTATYAGDVNYAGASGTATITVSQVAIAVPAPSPVTPGASANATVTLAAGSNYSGTMNLTCALTGSPTGAQSLPTCALNPASITIASGASGTTTLTISTTAASGTALSRPFRLWGVGGGGALVAVAFLFGLPSRRRRSASLWALIGLAIAAWTIGCGGSGASSGGSNTTGQSTPATTAGNYTFTVTGTDAANARISSAASVVVSVQ